MNLTSALHTALHEGNLCKYVDEKTCPTWGRANRSLPFLITEMKEMVKETPELPRRATVWIPSSVTAFTDDDVSATARILRKHLASEHRLWGPVTTYRDLLDVHIREHKSPGTIYTNHQSSSREWNRHRVRATEDEALREEEEE